MGTSFEVWVRRQLAELVKSRIGLLEGELSNLQREVAELFNRVLERIDVSASESDQAIAQLAAEINLQAGQLGSQLASQFALLRDSVAELDKQRTQAEVLNALVARAANFAPRVALFVVKGGNAIGWSASGLKGDLEGGSIRGLSISLESDTVLRAALGSQQTFYGSPDQQAANDLLLSRFGPSRPQRLLAVPLKVRGKPAAVLYADSDDRGPEAINVEAIELLVSIAGLVVELTSLRSRLSEVTRQAQPRPSGPLQPSGELRQQPHPSGELPRQAQPSGELRQQASPNFFKPVVEPPQATAKPQQQPSQEEKLHLEARRFARLLVSEIILYNEQKVIEGRKNRDLYQRLKDDIDRSRQAYEKRVAPSVAAKFDYLYDELVNTLAEGDPSKLGPDFPGPSLRSA